MKELKLIDAPISSKEDESLGVAMYAEVLANFIKMAETPITIGIQGDWGIGKTSLLNMVNEQLGPRRGLIKKYHTIYFNTWQYSQFKQEELLGLSILKGIMEEIQNLDTFKNRDSESFKSAIHTFGKFVTNLGNQIVKKQTGLDVKAAVTEGETSGENLFEDDIVLYLLRMKDEFKTLVDSILENEGDKLVIMIDDLDRIKPLRALEFLEAIKNFLDVENCVFVMAVDYSVIQSGMVEKLGQSAQELQGKSYFDKIIQVPFNMPVGSYQTDRYIMSLLGWDFDNEGRRYIKQKRDNFYLKIKHSTISEPDCDYFSNITTLTVGKNPRGIKRAVNYASLLKMIVEMKRKAKGLGSSWQIKDAKLLYALSCLQLAWPELFVHFAEKPSPKTIHLFEDFEYISSLKGIDALFKRVHNPEETKSNITGFFDEFVSLVDEDGNGEIDAKEFKPIWEMMFDANLTNSKLAELDEKWAKLAKMIMASMAKKGNKDIDYVKKVLGLFRLSNSPWNDANKFNLLGAGKKFVNMLWDGNQVGSIVTTIKEPIQLYFKINPVFLRKTLPPEYSEIVEDVRKVGHYGTGDTKINIPMLFDSGKSFQIINHINKILKRLKTNKRPRALAANPSTS